MTEIQYKLCTHCKQEFPATSEHFYRDKKQPSGYACWCKTCYADSAGAKSRRIIKRCEDGFRECRTCKQIFPETSEYFATAKNRPKGLRHECRECKRLRGLASSRKVADARNERNRERYNTDPEYKAYIKEQARKWKEDNPEEYKAKKKKDYEKHKDKRLAQMKAKYPERRDKILAQHRANSSKRDPLKRCLEAHKRLARKRGLPFDYTPEDWLACLEYFGHKCAVCGRPENDIHLLAKDHWIALSDKRSDNPGTVPHNIVPLCHTRRGKGGNIIGCNDSKLNADPLTWLASRYSPAEVEAILARINEYFDKVKR